MVAVVQDLVTTGRSACRWCRELLSPTARRDSVYCSQRCRQAAHRFGRAVAHDVHHDASRRMRFGYADPPYPGLSKRYYGDHPDFAGEVDHEQLVAELSSPGRYDGWALSTSAAALPEVLSICRRYTTVRVGVWVRGARARRNPRGPLSSWEPVVYAGGRDGSHRVDSLIHHARPRTTDPGRVIGAKPAAFARWMFELLGAQPGDELVDLYPGSGGIARAWDLFTVVKPDASCGSNTDASFVDDGHASAAALHDASTGPSPSHVVLRPGDTSLVATLDGSAA